MAAATPGVAGGVGLSRIGLDLLLGCAAATIEAAAAFATVSRPAIVAEAVVSVACAPTRDVGAQDGWRGFIRCGDEWLSLALANQDEISRVRAWLDRHGARYDRCAGIVSDHLCVADLVPRFQELGIAALPAAPATLEAFDPAQYGGHGRVEHSEWVREPGKPLSGLRVVDCGQLAAGPHAGAVLRDLGADVVGLSHPARALSRWHGGDPELVDLRSAPGRGRFLDYCRDADLVLDNFRCRVWDNLQLDPLAAGARIHLRLPAFPDLDERSQWKAFGFQTEAMLGVGLGPCPQAASVVRAPSIAVLDHAVGFAGVATALDWLQTNRSGRLVVSHIDVARLAQPASRC
jgi:hypothetical protein